MKKMILGLALCLGMSQVVVADTAKDLSLSDKEVQGAMAWIKAHPKTVAGIFAGVVAAAGVTYAGYNIYKSEKEGKMAKVKDGAYNAFAKPVVDAWGWTSTKVTGYKAAIGNSMSEHKKLWIGVPTAVILVVAAAAIAHYSEVDKEAAKKIQELWNKLFEKKEVVA